MNFEDIEKLEEVFGGRKSTRKYLVKNLYIISITFDILKKLWVRPFLN